MEATMKHKHLSPAVYTPLPAYMADPRMRFARFIDGDGAGGTNDGGDGGQQGDQQPGQQPQGGDGTDHLGEGGVKALQTEREARKAAEKALSEREARIKELEDASKSDDQKRSERFEALEKSDREKDGTISSLQAQILRYEVAAAKGLDLAAARRLQGATREEIEADADEFARSFARSGGVIPGAGSRGTEERIDPGPGVNRMRAAYEASAKN
jgi:hypothetical protein